MVDAKLIQCSDIAIIKQAGEVAYRTESKKNVEQYIDMLITLDHTSVLEHCSYTFLLTCDLGVSHELVRHRIASYTQESTRYVDFTKKGVSFNIPEVLSEEDRDKLISLLGDTETLYSEFKAKYGKDVARGLLPKITGTTVIMTINARSLLNFFKLRHHHTAHPDMQKLALKMYETLPKEHQYIYRNFFISNNK